MRQFSIFSKLLSFILMVWSVPQLNAQCGGSCTPLSTVFSEDFSSGQHYLTTLNNHCGCSVNSYCYTTLASSKCGTLNNIGDHTTGSQTYCVVQSDSSNYILSTFSGISIVAGRTYEVEAWVYPDVGTGSDRPTITLTFGGSTVATLNTAGIPNQWTKICGTYTASSTGSTGLTVSQTAAGAPGNFNYGIDDLKIVEYDCATDPCQYRVNVDPIVEACKLDLSNFSISASAPVEVVSVTWTFGDGYSSSEVNPIHYYQTPGLYKVCYEIVTLNPVTRECCIQKKCFNVTIDEECAECQLGHTNFNVALDNSCCEYSFEGIAGSNSEIIGWLWDFGDGTSGTGQDAEHVYSSPGSYNVCLTVIGRRNGGEDCCVMQVCRQVNVDCSGKKSQPSQKITGTTDKTTEEGWEIYPNPSSGTFTLHSVKPVKGGINVTVMDASGKVIVSQDKKISDNNIEVENLDVTPGMYFIRIQNENEDTVQKIVIE